MILASHLRATLEMPAFVVGKFLDDLEDADLLVRPWPSMNHIAWQLGHLISSEHFHVSQVCPGGMPPLPAGFAEQHAQATAAWDDPSRFRSKQEYLARMNEQRAGTLALLSSLSDQQLSRPSPEQLRYFGPTVASVFAGEAAHWMMHVGQWSVVRRKLGKPVLF